MTASSPAAAPSDLSQARAWAVAAAVPDPEIPVVTVADLGILRSVELIDGVAVAKVSPTYTGCPAVLAIELAIEAALLGAGFTPKVERVISPAWSTDWISEEGRAKLLAYGIAPPTQARHSVRALFDTQPVACPRCASENTERLSEFGATPCKAMYRCQDCREPFEAFKCL